MYLTVKQQIKHLSKSDYRTLKELCHIAKNLANEAIYNVRQYYFDEGKYLNYEKNYVLLKNSPNKFQYGTTNSQGSRWHIQVVLFIVEDGQTGQIPYECLSLATLSAKGWAYDTGDWFCST